MVNRVGQINIMEHIGGTLGDQFPSIEVSWVA